MNTSYTFFSQGFDRSMITKWSYGVSECQCCSSVSPLCHCKDKRRPNWKWPFCMCLIRNWIFQRRPAQWIPTPLSYWRCRVWLNLFAFIYSLLTYLFTDLHNVKCQCVRNAQLFLFDSTYTPQSPHQQYPDTYPIHISILGEIIWIQFKK